MKNKKINFINLIFTERMKAKMEANLKRICFNLLLILFTNMIDYIISF